MSTRGAVRIGVGGWTFPPWRGVFYPDDLAQKNELAYASQHLTAIEINGTYYGSQKPESFRKWAKETPEGFVFTLKGNRFCTNRKVLAEAGESVGRFFDQGVTELGDKLGPVLWQFAPTKKFDEADFGGFLELLPRKVGGREIRQVHLDEAHPLAGLCEPSLCQLEHRWRGIEGDDMAPRQACEQLLGDATCPATRVDDGLVALQLQALQHSPAPAGLGRRHPVIARPVPVHRGRFYGRRAVRSLENEQGPSRAQ